MFYEQKENKNEKTNVNLGCTAARCGRWVDMEVHPARNINVRRNDMEDFEQDFSDCKTTPIRQFDLILRDIKNMFEKGRPTQEIKQYVRGLVDGNRFARECPEIKPISKS